MNSFRLHSFPEQIKPKLTKTFQISTGVPYAEPPVGQHRFEPPTTQTPWTGVRHFVSFGPVCPQVLPNSKEEIDGARHRYLKRLLPFLQHQDEDCLYLNIYTPHQNGSKYLEFLSSSTYIVEMMRVYLVTLTESRPFELGLGR